MYCPNCGKKQLEDDNVLCTFCEKRLPREGAEIAPANKTGVSDAAYKEIETTASPEEPKILEEKVESVGAHHPEHHLKRSFWHLISASILTFVTVLYGIFSITHVYTTGFGIGTLSEHIHLFHLGYDSGQRLFAYIFSALAIVNGILCISFKKKVNPKFVAHENKIEVLVLVLAIVSFAVPILMSVFPVVEL